MIHESLSGGITDFFDELHIHFERLSDIYFPLLLHSGIQTDQTGQHHYGSFPSYQIPNDVTIKLNGTGFIPLGKVSYSEAYFEEYIPDMLISRSKNNNSFGKLTELHVHTNSGRPQFIRKPDSTTYSKGFDVKGEYLTV